MTIYRAITIVVATKDWSTASPRDGFAMGQAFVADRILENLGIEDVPFLEARPLNEEDMALPLPRRTRLTPLMLAAARPRGQPLPALPAPPEPPALMPTPVWHGRLRSSSRLSLPASPAEASEPSAIAAGAAAAADLP